MLAKVKYIGAGIACSGLIGAGAGIGAKHSFHSSAFLKSERKTLLIKIKTFTNKQGLAFKEWFIQKWGKHSIFLGFIRAYNIPTLPATVELFYSHIFVRIGRFIGGLSFVLIVTKLYLVLPGFLHLFLAILASIQITQIIIILIIKILFGLYTLFFKSEKFEIRNSPLNRYASVISQALYCIKIGCAVTGAGASFIAGGAAYDSVLTESGRNPVFVPFMAKTYNIIFGEGPNTKVTTFIEKNVKTNTANSNNKESVTEVLAKFHKMSSEEKADFISEIKKENDNK
jgi:hypothetical protein